MTTTTDPAYGAQAQPYDPFTGPAANPYPQFAAGVGGDLQSNNVLQQIAGQLGGAGEFTAANAQSQIGAQEQGYLTELANNALGNQFATNEAGYQTGQLQFKGQQIGIEQLGNTQEQQLQGVEQPIQTSQLQGSLAAQGALNTKGSQQQQQQLGAQQKYTNEQLANAQNQLGIMAQANGASVQEVQNQLNYALAQSGLSGQMDAVGLLNAISQINAGEFTGLENTVSPLLFAAGLNGFSGASVPQPGFSNLTQGFNSFFGGL
jgi:hypothetical protein